MTDMELLDFMVRQYLTQRKLADSLHIGEASISNWRAKKAVPHAWRMYFEAQFAKKGKK